MCVSTQRSENQLRRRNPRTSRDGAAGGHRRPAPLPPATRRDHELPAPPGRERL